MEHSFTSLIRTVLYNHFKEVASLLFDRSLLIQYLNIKTKSANRGSKSRGSFANLYAIYVLVEDYLRKGFGTKDKRGQYANYAGAVYSDLLRRQRELPFGAKLQNHALNNRVNTEFEKYFPTSNLIPILRNQETNRYWINENLLLVSINNREYNIAPAVMEVVDEYIRVKQDAFIRFINQCKVIREIGAEGEEQVADFCKKILAPNVDARLFEIVSYSILKHYYKDQVIYWGYEEANVVPEKLKLYKTGRTNANDGGIDFVMRPLGRFFQVTETLDFKKYFLDIEKIEKYPVTFVVKSNDSVGTILGRIKSNALKAYPVHSIVDKYMECIEEIINIPVLMDCFISIKDKGQVMGVLDEIVLQSKVEFNYDEEDMEV